MQDVKVQITEQNIQYKHELKLSFAQILNTLLDIARTNPEVEQKMIAKISNK